METLLEMLRDLGDDPWQKDAFDRDPEPFLREVRLTARQFAELLGEATLARVGADWQRCSSVLDPGWDPSPIPDPPPADSD
jgi:hypothetical protein